MIMMAFMGCKTQGARKGPKRTTVDRKLDENDDADLQDLASVLFEHALDVNAEGWFKLPWRDGWNAVSLAVYAHIALDEQKRVRIVDDVATFVVDAITKKSTESIVYWTADEYLTISPRAVTMSPFLRAALQSLQLLVSNSHGGGEQYNFPLMRAFRAERPEVHTDLVTHYRCLDAIGSTEVMQGDRFDRVRSAFVTAWRRGLFHAAYALPKIPREP